MYKILIKKGKDPVLYSVYQVEIIDMTEGKKMVDYETSSLSELADKYKELQKTYNSEVIIPYHELNIEETVLISE